MFYLIAKSQRIFKWSRKHFAMSWSKLCAVGNLLWANRNTQCAHLSLGKESSSSEILKKRGVEFRLLEVSVFALVDRPIAWLSSIWPSANPNWQTTLSHNPFKRSSTPPTQPVHDFINCSSELTTFFHFFLMKTDRWLNCSSRKREGAAFF